MTAETPELKERPEETLDPASPAEWDRFRALAHRMVDDMLDYHAGQRERPAWQPIPEDVRGSYRGAVPREGADAEAVYEEFTRTILPYPYGNVHPRHWGWVNGQGSPLGSMAEMLAATMNPNCWGGEHAAAYVEAQVIEWMREAMGMPEGTGGLLVSGGSMGNVLGLAAARHHTLPEAARSGLAAEGSRPVVYASAEVHNSVDKGAALLGVGSRNLRSIPVDAAYRMKLDALRSAIHDDRRKGRRPMAVVAAAGTVNTGATDDLQGLADLCAQEELWMHVDGAFGAVARLSPALAPLLSGIERADSLSFDFHKWMYVPIEAACVLVRDPDHLRATLGPGASYLSRFDRGPAAGEHFFSPLGPQLTRSFRALKVWFYLRTYGLEKLGRLVEQNVRQARRLEEALREEPALESMAPVPLNVVCFRYRGDVDETELNDFNKELLQRLWESGVAAPSSTLLDGRFVLRAAFSNHRTRMEDIDVLVDAVRGIGEAMEGEIR